MPIEAIEGKRAAEADLRRFVAGLLSAAGADAPSAAAVARAVIDASARGVDTHGIRLIPWYLEMLEGERINPRPRLTVSATASAVGHVDADNGFGHLASYRAIEEGCRIAAGTGIAAVTVARSSHHGATGVYTLEAARQGFAAIGMTHADRLVVPDGGREPFFGTNPISFAIPVPGEAPLLLDMATSAIPFNRVILRRDTGTKLPPDVAVDAAGATTRDPHEAVALLPLGGAAFGYKGAGLAAMIDILCSAFTGMLHGAAMESFGGPDYSQPIPIGHFFILFRPADFFGAETCDARLAALLSDLRSQPAAPGRKVMAPGDLEKAEADRRRRDGIPVDAATWDTLATAAARHGLPLPPATDTGPHA